MKRSRRAILTALLALGASTTACLADVDFEKEIKPILEQACIQCHGPEKQKGKLRLDSREALAKGGESGSPVAAGKPEESDFLRRVTLDAGHEDVMPPKGKAEHLTATEIELVKRWIFDGARWPEGVIAVAATRPGAMTAGPTPSPAELAARTALAKFGVRVRPLATGVNWTRVSFRNVTGELPEDAWELVGRLTNTVELDLSGTKHAEDHQNALAGLSNLTALNLSQTAVTDAGLDRLAKLEKLATLNLYSTRITDAGLEKLAVHKQLKQLYLAGSGVTAAGIAALKAALPVVRMDEGAEFIELTKKGPVPAPAKTPEAAKPAELK